MNASRFGEFRFLNECIANSRTVNKVIGNLFQFTRSLGNKLSRIISRFRILMQKYGQTEALIGHNQVFSGRCHGYYYKKKRF